MDLTHRLLTLRDDPDNHPQLNAKEIDQVLLTEEKLRQAEHTIQRLTESLDRVHDFLPRTKDNVPITGQPLYLHETSTKILTCSNYHLTDHIIVHDPETRYSFYKPANFTYEKNLPTPEPPVERSRPTLARRRH